MPFTKLVPTRHRCKLPLTRDDSTPLQGGDEWRCDEVLADEWSETTTPSVCKRVYRWTALPFKGRWAYVVPGQLDHYKEDT